MPPPTSAADSSSTRAADGFGKAKNDQILAARNRAQTGWREPRTISVMVAGPSQFLVMPNSALLALSCLLARNT